MMTKPMIIQGAVTVTIPTTTATADA